MTMLKRSLLIICVTIATGTTVYSQSTPMIEIPLFMAGDNCPICNPNPNVTNHFIGIDEMASDGLDVFDNPSPPSFKFTGFGNVSFNAGILGVSLLKDIRPPSDEMSWELEICFGVPADDVTMSWDPSLFQPGGSVFEAGYDRAEIVTFEGLLLADMTVASTTTFSDSGTGIASFFIELFRAPIPPPSLVVSPPSGTYFTTQQFDVAFIVFNPGSGSFEIEADFDGFDLSRILVECIFSTNGIGFHGEGFTLECNGTSGADFGPGAHTFDVTLRFEDGTEISQSVDWNIIQNVLLDPPN